MKETEDAQSSVSGEPLGPKPPDVPALMVPYSHMKKGLHFQWHKPVCPLLFLFFVFHKAVLHFLYLSGGFKDRIRVSERNPKLLNRG